MYFFTFDAHMEVDVRNYDMKQLPDLPSIVFMSILIVMESAAPLDPAASEHDSVFPSSSSLGSYSTD